jgi:hypothetical protein
VARLIRDHQDVGPYRNEERTLGESEFREPMELTLASLTCFTFRLDIFFTKAAQRCQRESGATSEKTGIKTQVAYYFIRLKAQAKMFYSGAFEDAFERRSEEKI